MKAAINMYSIVCVESQTDGIVGKVVLEACGA